MQEIWKPIEGYKYQISNLGHVKRNGRINFLKPWEVGNGYLTVSLCEDGKVAKFYIHQLVCKVFHGPRLNGMQVNHIDLNIRNNSSKNLEWTTRLENIRHYNKFLAKSHKCNLKKSFFIRCPNRKGRACKKCGKFIK